MELDAMNVIRDMKLPNYKRMVKLFVQWGDRHQQIEFLDLLRDQMQVPKQKAMLIADEIREFQLKIDGLMPTQLSAEYCQKEIQKRQSKLNSAKKELKRLQTMYDYLEGLMT